MLHFPQISVGPTQKQVLVNGFPVSDMLGGIGLIVAGFAAWQAARSARATAQANIQAVLPILTIKYIQETGGMSGHVIIRNTGHGPAFNISIPKYRMYLGEPRWTQFGSVITQLQLLAIPDDLGPGEERQLVSHELEDGIPIDGNAHGFLTMLIMGGAAHGLRVPIRYRDIGGNRYITYLETGRNYVRVLRPSRRFRLVEATRYWLRYEAANFLRDKYLWLQHRKQNRRARKHAESEKKKEGQEHDPK